MAARERIEALTRAGDTLSMGPQSCRTIVGPRVRPRPLI